MLNSNDLSICCYAVSWHQLSRLLRHTSIKYWKALTRNFSTVWSTSFRSNSGMHLLTLAYLAVTIATTSSFRSSVLFRGISKRDFDIHYSSSDKRRLEASNFRHLLKEHREFSMVTSRPMTAADMDWDPKSAPKLDFNEDFYSILEVDPEIKGKELKKAYYKIVFKYHPDNKEGQEQKDLCNKQMMVINAAYKILKDDDARVAYDRKRRMGVYGEAAKVGKSSGGNSNSRSQAQTQTQQTQRKASSYSSSSSSDPFNGYYRKEPEDSGSTESLGDIFSDFWSEIRKGETKNLVVDLLDFLEDQVILALQNYLGHLCALIFNYNSILWVVFISLILLLLWYVFITKIPNSQSGGNPMGDIYSQVRSGGKTQTQTEGPRSKARVDSEVQIMQSAISNLKVETYIYLYYRWIVRNEEADRNAGENLLSVHFSSIQNRIIYSCEINVSHNNITKLPFPLSTLLSTVSHGRYDEGAIRLHS